ncbi:MAG: carbon-nitrogen hydrolase [Acidobacteria bacterium]|nr:carbon-nitrogen hydrolase [Acidobacteriota bacterium]MCB9396770.1 carbon-nitrogen hydrolase [Acidobacteriota bacterium]
MKSPKGKLVRPQLLVRCATMQDVPEIYALTERVYPNMPPYKLDMLRGQINHFPQGQFVAIYQDVIVGYCATFRVDGQMALVPHKWKEITGYGYGSTHDPDGDYLYGMEVCVDPHVRGWRIGKRLYEERKKLCKNLKLKGIVFGGRLPGLSRRIKQFGTAEKYVEAVHARKVRDAVLTFQLANGFKFLRLMPDYLPFDKESMGYAALMVWENPLVLSATEPNRTPTGRLPDTVRVAAIQYHQRRIENWDQFKTYVEYFVDVVADYRADFAVFPELFTLQLLSMEPENLGPREAIEALTHYAQQFVPFMQSLAIRYNVNIIGGSLPTHVEGNEVQNVAYVFLRDGSVHTQSKIHPTPSERSWWNIQGGDELHTIQTDCGPIGVLICYDAEFPELARHLVNQGAFILFVPFCTDERQAYLRVRYCAQARAVENQCYVVLAGNVGNLPSVHNMDIQYAQSCILTPCDFPFSRDGIAADTTPNVEMICLADLHPSHIRIARHEGTVQNLKDRRHDLYEIRWKK